MTTTLSVSSLQDFISDEAIARVARSAGFRGDNLIIAVAVCLGESSGNRLAFNPAGAYGLWQIFKPAHPYLFAHFNWRDPEQNAQMAKQVFDEVGGSWHPWVAYTNKTYKRFLRRARKVAGPDSHHNNGGHGTPGSTAPPVVNIPDPGTKLERVMRTKQDLVLAGVDMIDNIRAAITSVEIKRTINGAPTLTLNMEDPDRTIIRSGIFAHRVTVHLHPFTYEVVQVSKSGSSLTVTCEDQVVAELRKHNTKLAVGAQLMTHVHFARKMVNEVPWIKFRTDNDIHVPLSKAPLTRGEQGRRGKHENSWDALNRIAQERGWRVFIGGNDVVWYVPDRFLIESQVPFDIAEEDDGVDNIDFDFDEGKKTAQLTITCRTDLWEVPPGGICLVSKLGAANGKWVIQDITRGATSKTTEIIAVRAQPILPEPRLASGASSGGVAGGEAAFNVTVNGAGPESQAHGGPAPARTNSRSNLDFVNEALSQVGKPYVYGAQTSPSNNNPKSFDCSLLVEWAAGRVGIALPRTSGSQYQMCHTYHTLIDVVRASRVRGALLFYGVGGSQHVAISLGNGQDTIEARGHAYGVNKQRLWDIDWGAAALVPGMRY